MTNYSLTDEAAQARDAELAKKSAMHGLRYKKGFDDALNSRIDTSIIKSQGDHSEGYVEGISDYEAEFGGTSQK